MSNWSKLNQYLAFSIIQKQKLRFCYCAAKPRVKHDFIQLMGKKEFRLVYIVVNTCFQEIIGITLLHQTESTQNKSPLFLIPYPRI